MIIVTIFSIVTSILSETYSWKRKKKSVGQDLILWLDLDWTVIFSCEWQVAVIIREEMSLWGRRNIYIFGRGHFLKDL